MGMAGAFKFIQALIWIALTLGATGTLLDATIFFGNKAQTAQQKGGIKFKELNSILNKKK